MRIVFRWDLKPIFWHCHIYEKTLITRIILGENNLISGTRRCASRTNTAWGRRAAARGWISELSSKKNFHFFDTAPLFPPVSFLIFVLIAQMNPSSKDLFPQILYAIFCLDLLLLSSSYPQYPSTGLSLIITAFHPPCCLLTLSSIINIFLSQVYPARHAPQHCDQHSQILWGNLT